MFRKLKERMAEMSAAAVEVPRGDTFLKLMEVAKHSPEEAAVIAQACYPLLGQKPNRRELEEFLRDGSLTFAKEISHMGRNEAVDLALKYLDAYRAMAWYAKDTTYVVWFEDAINVYHRDAKA